MYHMLQEFDKPKFILHYTKYLKLNSSMFSEKEYSQLLLTIELPRIQKLLYNKIYMNIKWLQQLHFTNDLKQNNQFKYTIKQINRFVKRSFQMFYQFHFTSFQVYEKLFYSLQSTLRNKYIRTQKKIQKCLLLQTYIPKDICIHIIYSFLK